MRLTRSTITPEFINNYKQFLINNNPIDHHQFEYLRNNFSLLRVAHVFQIFEILNRREAVFQKQFQNIFSQIRNSRPAMSIQTQTRTQNNRQQQNPMGMAGNQQANVAGAPGGGNPGGNANHGPGGGQPGGNPGGDPGGNPGGYPHGNPQQRTNLPNPQRIIFVDDPFIGDINPGTSEGAKLYMKGTAQIDDDDKFDITIANAQKFLYHMTRDTNTFGWGILVRYIQVGPNDFKNILVDHKDIAKEDVKRQAYRTWGNHLATFQDPVPREYFEYIFVKHLKPEVIQ